MNYKIHTTEQFDEWVSDIRDQRATVAIYNRITRAISGNLDDVSSVGDGVSEMRIFVGKGYRLYFTIRQQSLVILLCGGDKSSQKRDIKKAKKILKAL